MTMQLILMLMMIAKVFSEVTSNCEAGGHGKSKILEPLKTVLFLGSTRDGRYGSRVGQFLKKLLEEEYGHQVDVIDPLEIDFPMLKMPLHFYPDQSQAPSWLIEVNERIKRADAYLLVSSEYNYSIPPALSNMLDHFPMQSFAFKPTGIAVYSLGTIGGQRVVPQLLNLLNAFQTIAIPEVLSITAVHEALNAEGNPTRDRVFESAKKMADQLDWYARATKAQRKVSGLSCQVQREIVIS